jgi:hypothetical protein
LSTSRQQLLHVPPARHHCPQQLVSLGARLSIRLHRFLVRLDDGLVHVGEHFAAAVFRFELRDRFDGANPAGRIGWNFHRVLVILLDRSDGFAQGPMQDAGS